MVSFELSFRKWGRPKKGSTVRVEGSDVGELILRRSLNMDSVVVLSSRRMTYLGDEVDSMQSTAAVVISSDVAMGIFGWCLERGSRCG